MITNSSGTSHDNILRNLYLYNLWKCYWLTLIFWSEILIQFSTCMDLQLHISPAAAHPDWLFLLCYLLISKGNLSGDFLGQFDVIYNAIDIYYTILNPAWNWRLAYESFSTHTFLSALALTLSRCRLIFNPHLLFIC
jgi:hypothetical protein